MSDEFIPSLVSLKVGDKPSDEAAARDAVALIANHRKSNALKNWINTNVLGDVEMDIDHAYARLDIGDRTIDDSTILAAFNYNVEEQPSQVHDLNRALTAIAKSRDSKILKNRLGIGIESPTHSLSEWPVGIENIGNTCYLNSLLQFYFTIKPLRELVLDIDRFKTPTDDETLRQKRVGSRIVSRKEVDRAQRTVDELKRLFQDLISLAKQSLKPDAEVARLTLLSSSKAEQARRHSILSIERPSLEAPLGAMNGVPIQGPAAEAPTDLAAIATQADTEMLDSTAVDTPTDTAIMDDSHSDASSNTLVNGPAGAEPAVALEPAIEQQQIVLDDKENLPPSKAVEEISAESQLSPLNEASPSRLNEQPTQIIEKEPEKETVDLTGDDSVSPATNGLPPSRPPPIPPRPKPAADVALKEAEYGAQQDVNEVIGNVLFQLQCAIKPEAVDKDGEQLDRVKHLFFAKQKTYTTNRQGVIRTKEEYMSDIKIDPEACPRTIYDALDGAFDVQDVEVAGGIEPQYSTISQLPPVLQVHIQRTQFNPQSRSQFKSIKHVELRDTIYMDRYMDSADPEVLRRRQECWEWKRELRRLENRKSRLNAPEVSMNVGGHTVY